MRPGPEWTYRRDVGSARELQVLARDLAHSLDAGDLVVLSGELGAGKTTFTQGLGLGLGVRERIISPTFVLVRQHPSDGPGAGLVHVDAYRLDSAAALDDLDLESTLGANVTVVEWGEGKVEHLSGSRLLITLGRPSGTEQAPPSGPDGIHLDLSFDDDGEDEVRTVTLSGYGPRWRGRRPDLLLD